MTAASSWVNLNRLGLRFTSAMACSADHRPPILALARHKVPSLMMITVALRSPVIIVEADSATFIGRPLEVGEKRSYHPENPLWQRANGG